VVTGPATVVEDVSTGAEVVVLPPATVVEDEPVVVAPLSSPPPQATATRETSRQAVRPTVVVPAVRRVT
jgi:hypothetical protein